MYNCKHKTKIVFLIQDFKKKFFITLLKSIPFSIIYNTPVFLGFKAPALNSTVVPQECNPSCMTRRYWQNLHCILGNRTIDATDLCVWHNPKTLFAIRLCIIHKCKRSLKKVLHFYLWLLVNSNKI